MTTRSGRFGPRIGGYRHKPSYDYGKGGLPHNAAAFLYRAAIHAAHGHASDLIYVIAFTDEQAEEFVRLRRDDYATAEDIQVMSMGYIGEHLHLSEAVLGFETPEEAAARKEWFDNEQEAAAERAFTSDMADGGSTPSGIRELTDAAYRQRRETR